MDPCPGRLQRARLPSHLCGLSAHEQQPLWATRVDALRQVPPLFEASKMAKTTTGLTWDVAMSVRRVLTKEGRVTTATGTGDTYRELETPTKVHGLVGAVFNKMWEEESLSRHFPTYQEFDLVATTIRTVYNETARSDYANGQIHTPAPWG